MERPIQVAADDKRPASDRELCDSTADNKGQKQITASSSMLKHQRRTRFVITLAVIAITTCLLYYYVSRTVPEFNHYRLLETYARLDADDEFHRRPRTILFWNDFFGNKRWYLPDDTMGPSHFRDEFQCPEYRCVLTNQHTYLPTLDMYDAIIFHTATAFPAFKSVPEVRRPEQLYVFTSMECPAETKHKLDDEQNFYNLTMTYRLDSDIVWPYNFILDRTTDLPVAPAKYPVWKTPPTHWNDSDVWALWPSKTKMAAWFVSHCGTMSQRERLAKALQKHIQVDIYGACGTLTCERGNADCETMLDEQYKFYFAFENTLCRDYVTEKAFNALKRHIVPVVFGGANYTRFLPPLSYIDAERYATVEELAAYLKYLAENPEAYMRYFWWRPHYRSGYHRSQYCDLCELLNSQTTRYKTQMYGNIEQWWIADSCYLKPKIKI